MVRRRLAFRHDAFGRKDAYDNGDHMGTLTPARPWGGSLDQRLVSAEDALGLNYPPIGAECSTPTVTCSGWPPRRGASRRYTCSIPIRRSRAQASSRCPTRSKPSTRNCCPVRPLSFLLADDPGAEVTNSMRTAINKADRYLVLQLDSTGMRCGSGQSCASKMRPRLRDEAASLRKELKALAEITL